MFLTNLGYSCVCVCGGGKCVGEVCLCSRQLDRHKQSRNDGSGAEGHQGREARP